MKTLKEIQEENRKFIIMANNPTAKTYEEALEMELLDQIPCLVKVKYNGNQNEFDRLIFYTLQNEDGQELVEMGGERMPRKIVSRIIGGLLTLNRVLKALESKKYYRITKSIGYLWGSLVEHLEEDYEDIVDGLCEWDLKKETLEEQRDETQRKINELIK